MTRLDVQEKKTLKAWPMLLWGFTKREWLLVFVWSGLGAAASGTMRLVFWDDSFQEFLISKLVPTTTPFEDPQLYFPYIVIVIIAVVLGFAPRIPRYVWRGIRSWWTGVTSGLAFLSFTSTFVLLTLRSSHLPYPLTAASAMLVVFFSLSFVRYLMARERLQVKPSEDELKVPPHIRSIVGTKSTESDDPIRSWEEDSLGRVSIVESMTAKLLISGSPVLALFGEFGSGKTSIFNLVRKHLEGRAIVVSVSTWLPGSQETLITYLLSDIAKECRAKYVVPGLQKSIRRLAKALGQHVPFLESYLKLLPDATQKEEVADLHEALERLPERVIVLLDEVDRMEKAELVGLLKVIRGLSNLPNVSFVYAGDRKTIVDMVKDGFNDKGNNYFEKFFPTSIPIPKAPPSVLRKIGVQRLVAGFSRRGWLESESEIEDFRQALNLIWEEKMAPFFRTPRAVGSLVNDVDAAALRLKREVHPLDLTLIELLRRFKPAVYDIVGNSPSALTGGSNVLRGEAFLLERDRASLEKQLVEELKKEISGDEEFRQVSAILGELFPHFREIDGLPRFSPPVAQGSELKRMNRVSQARIFSAYFDYELPENIFSYVELQEFLRKIYADINVDEVASAFSEKLDSMEKGSPRRDDFLMQLAAAAEQSIPLASGGALVRATMRAAHKYQYDMLAAFAEAGHVLRIVLRIAQRLPMPERLNLLAGCIIDATDDTMAFNILTKLTVKQDGLDLDVSSAQLYPAFRKRMRKRYGREVDASKVDLSTSDPWAFNYWGHVPKDEAIAFDPEDKSIQRDFWLGHIGTSRSRLAQDFRGFFMPANVAYSEDPTEFVENKIPIAELKRLDEQLPEDPNLSEVDRQSLKTLRRLLAGDFKNGFSFRGPYSEDDTQEQGA